MWPDVPDILLHALPVRHSAEADPFIVLGFLVVGVVAMVAAGIAVGTRVRLAAGARASFAAAFAAGAIVFLLFDLMKETASLGQGLVGNPLLQAVLVLAFAAGVVGLARIAASPGGGGTPDARRLAWAWTLGIAAHSMGEGWIVGTEALTADITDPLQASSFLLHKLAEGFTIPLVAGLALRTDDIVRLTAAVALPALLAAALGHALGPGAAPVVLFAVGAGAASYALLALARRVPLDTRHALGVAAGVAFVYLAGLLHEL